MIGMVLWLVSLACTVWVIYDVFTAQKKMETLHKVLWTVFALVIGIVAAIVYYLVVKKK